MNCLIQTWICFESKSIQMNHILIQIQKSVQF